MNETAQTWRLRAMACELLAASLRYPDAVLAQAVSSGAWTAAVREAGFGSCLHGDAPVDEGLAVDALLRRLRAEATRLFVGAPRAQVWAYEGPARAVAEGMEPVMFVGARSREVEEFCHACGFAGAGPSNEPLDYVATEFELLQNLAVIAFSDGTGAPAPDAGMRRRSYPGGSAAAAYRLFWDEHARAWLPGFADSLLACADTAFYRSVGCIVRAFLS